MQETHSKSTSPKVVLVLGKTGVGKSTFIKAATSLDVEVGHSLDSCTHEVQMYWVPNTTIFLIDTPGFDDPTRSDAEILHSIASCLADLHEGHVFDGHGVDLSGVIYVHSIDEPRMTGTMSQNLKMFRDLVGNDCMKHCVLLTTKWSLQENEKLAQDRENDLINNENYWKEYVGADANVKRFGDTKESAHEILATATGLGSFVPQLTSEYVVECRPLIDTSAGRSINKDLASLRELQEAGIAAIREEFIKAIDTRDQSLFDRLEALRVTTEKKLEKVSDDSRILAATREQAQERIDDLEFKKAVPLLPIGSPGSATSEDEQHLRRMRAMRWFVRFATVGSGVVMTGLSHGVLAPVAVSVIFGVEMILQASKDRELEAVRSCGQTRK